ncbi:MAG: glycogen debranching enzyme [Verrucomicrobiota bacterium]|nr:glycogen debranching enzyme [Verrucomicrobiota bacterium]
MRLDSLHLSPGSPSPLGYSKKGTKTNFALLAPHATEVILALRYQEKIKELPLVQENGVWSISIAEDLEGVHYAFRVLGVSDSATGLLFSPTSWLQDPFGLFSASQSMPWGSKRNDPWCLCKTPEPFDWQGVKKPNLHYSDLVIYEMHVRGFTCAAHPPHPGTYLGIIEKIPYLKKLGVNALELMPIFLFNELGIKNEDPVTKQPLPNYWGYQPLSFFIPMGGYGSLDPLLELKTLVRELHREGIELILDVVYNHTGEGRKEEETFSFRGIDNPLYYMVNEQGEYRDFTGCHNTFNSNQPAALNLILSSLRYWAEEVQVDGFRFDLAAVHVRGGKGQILQHPPLLEKIAGDEVLQQTKLIAEAWDAVGLYLVSTFPSFGPWSVWNGQFRDAVRRFIKGTPGCRDSFIDAMLGSPSLYSHYTPLRGINFVTAHDGFTLADLVSYNEKHNLANGEEGRDGNACNESWNCGAEGTTCDSAILELRERQQRNFLLALFLASGVPMLLMGDEYGHSRQGNNNAYPQDNPLNWFLWDQAEEKKERVNFLSQLILFRKKHPAFQTNRFLTPSEIQLLDGSDHFVAYVLAFSPRLLLAFNAGPHPFTITLPSGHWNELINTAHSWGKQNLECKEQRALPSHCEMSPYSALLLQEVMK